MARPWMDEEIAASYIPRKDEQGRALCQMHGCPNLLTGRQQRWCSSKCSNDSWASYVWNAQRKRILRRDNYTCSKCGVHDMCIDYEVDHIIPIIEGGKLCYPDNLRTICPGCHKKVTAALAARLAQARREKKAQERIAKHEAIYGKRL